MKQVALVAGAALLGSLVGVALAEGQACGKAVGCGAEVKSCGVAMAGCAAPVAKAAETVAPADAKVATLNTAGLKALLDAKVAVTVLDARSGKWDDGRRVPGAKSLNAGSSEEDVAKVVADKSALVVTYCAGVTCPASSKLAERLQKLGYKNVVEYPEGLAGWTKAGHAVDEPKK